MPRIQDIGGFNAVREAGLAKLTPAVPASPWAWAHAGAATARKRSFTRFMKRIERSGHDVVLAGVGCFGSCFQEPLVSVRLPGAAADHAAQRVQAQRRGTHSGRALPPR